MEIRSPEARVDEVLAWLEASAHSEYIGEGVSQLAHALQAAWLADRAGAAPVEICAGLLHDIGHLCASDEALRMEGLGVAEHERIGARYLASLGFPAALCALVAAHVDAKRYLVATKESYEARLSDASRATLTFQGGPMGAGESERFAGSPGFEAALRLRARDEQAKVPGLVVPGLDEYRPLLVALLTAGSQEG